LIHVSEKALKKDHSMTVAMLLSYDSFESFYGSVLQLDRDKYLENYRDEWSFDYAKGFIENGAHAIIYIPSNRHKGLYKTDVGVSVRFLPLAPWYLPIAYVRRAMRATRWSLYLQERINAIAFLKPLNEALVKDETDILYIEEYWGGRFDHLAHRMPVPIVAVDHGGVADGVVKWFKRSAFKQAAMLYSQTQQECFDVERYGGRTTLQANEEDTSFFFPPPSGSERTKTIVTLARLSDKQKRTSDLIRAMPLLSEDWTLDIIGTGPDRETLGALAIKLGVASRVNFCGFKSRAEVRSYMQHCGVYAMPSANEALCLAILEAMSCGASIVTSHVRAFERLITDGVNGKLFPVGDVPALAKAIEAAWTQRDTFGPAAAAFIEDKFNSKYLYAQLTQSLRSNAGFSAAVEPAAYARVKVSDAVQT
jgi:glycosyltransferase involved in cell wall biosynthesis